MLVFPQLSDRLIVLVTGIVMCGGVAFLVNRLRQRSDREHGR